MVSKVTKRILDFHIDQLLIRNSLTQQDYYVEWV